VRPVTAYFSLVLAHNRGAAFSMFDGGAGWQAHALTVVGITACLFILYMLRGTDRNGCSPARWR